MLKMHHDVAVHVLSYHVLELTAEIFSSFLQSHPITNAEKQAYQWFLDYIASSDCVNSDDFPQGKLNTLLKFSTGLWNIPPIQREINIHVKFLDDDDEEKLLKAGACTNILYIRAFFNIQAGGANAPPVPPCAPPRNHILPPQEKSLFPKIIQQTSED
jgi:oligoribonuclease NrnB/cAMP/cGMP phosphodiesterase (DHH superfamily)